MKNKGFAKVIIDLPSQEIDRPFEYSIPADLSNRVDIGSIVLVRFGYSHQLGYVIELTNETTIPSLSDILEVLDEQPVFDQEIVELCKWISLYYLTTFGQALKLALPPGRGRHLNQYILLNKPAEAILKKISPRASRQKEIILYLAEKEGKVALPELRKHLGQKALPTLRVLEKCGHIKRKYEASEPRVNVKKEEHIQLSISNEEAISILDKLLVKAPKQFAILKVLIDKPKISAHELLSASGASRESLKSLIKKGIVTPCFDLTYREPDFYYPEEIREKTTLTKEQVEAVRTINESISNDEFKVFLLQGITGSGKTEIYIKVIEEALKFGKTAIVLVPEIALTPQTAHRFRQAFDDKVAVLHSGLGTGERYDQWRRVRKGKYKVVIGARSALFAPLENLGVIVVDEEHETTYKQNKNPRYNAVAVALKRAELNGCPVVLGSATPAIESRFQVEQGAYHRIFLGKRVENRKLPTVEVVDMREEFRRGNKGIFSQNLQEEMTKCLDNGSKFILFLNRRGYSSFLLCRDCGFVPKCRRCAVSLTYHRDMVRLLCHHCSYSELAPEVCPSCGSVRIRDFGVGTQKVESELKRLYPDLSIIRMDADTTTGRDSHRKKLIEFKKKKNSVLLGTQMIAKGLDFPEVTLVGIINGDTALNLPDFRAAERTFQLLMQVSGRAGRGKQPGKVVLQTYLPDNYAIEALLHSDYDSFYQKEVELRRELRYPPFCRLVNILVSGKDESKVEDAADKISKFIEKNKPKEVISVLGPAPAPLSRVRNRYRWHLVLKVTDTQAVSRFLRDNYRQIDFRAPGKEISVIVDIDPVWML